MVAWFHSNIPRIKTNFVLILNLSSAVNKSTLDWKITYKLPKFTKPPDSKLDEIKVSECSLRAHFRWKLQGTLHLKKQICHALSTFLDFEGGLDDIEHKIICPGSKQLHHYKFHWWPNLTQKYQTIKILHEECFWTS